MSSSRALARRATAAGITAAVTAATLVTAAPAQAGTGTTTYNCTFPVIGSVPVPVVGTFPDLPAVPAGTPIPAGSLDPTFVFDATNIASVLGLVTSPSTSGLDLGLGDSASIPLQGFSFGSLSGTSLPASASNLDFGVPVVPGVYDVTMPDAFSFTALLSGSPVEAPCLTDAPAVLSSLTVLEPGGEPALLTSTTEATLAKKKIRKGKKAKVTATVTATSPLPLPNPVPPMGDVVVKKGKKTVGTGTLDSGSVTIVTKAFKKPGRYKLKVKYAGDPLTSGSKDTVVLRVKRRR